MSDTKNMDAAPASGAPDLPPLPDAHAALRRLAESATPGPWMRLFGERTVYDRMEDGCRGNAIVRAGQAWGATDSVNLDFIAAANPARIIALLDEVADLRAALAQAAPASPASAPVAPTVEFVMLSDMVEVDHPDHGRGYFCTVDCVRTMEATPTAALAVKVEAQQAGVVEVGEVEDMTVWVVRHNGRTVEGATLTEVLVKAKKLRTEAEQLIAAKNLFAAIEQERLEALAERTAMPVPVNDAEMAALKRFHECVTDGEGWDVPKEMMQRLARIGLVRRVTANLYEHTEFGLSALDELIAAPLPPVVARKVLTDELRALLAESRLGQGSYHTNYDGATLGRGIEDLIERHLTGGE